MVFLTEIYFRLELLAFLVLYFTLSILYRTIFIHDEAQREYFELLCIFSSRFAFRKWYSSQTIHVSFLDLTKF